MMPYFNQSPPPSENLVELKFKELVLSLLTTENKELLAYLNSLYNDKHPSIRNVRNGKRQPGENLRRARRNFRPKFATTSLTDERS